MKCFYINPDQSLAFVGERLALTNFVRGTREVDVDVHKLAASDLPAGISANRLHRLADQGYYLIEHDNRYEFTKVNPNPPPPPPDDENPPPENGV